MVKGDEKTYVEKNCYDDVPCTGGTTTHILEAVGTERLAFKVKLKEKYYDLYQVSPPLGFVKPGVKKKLFLRRLPGKPGKTKLVVEYIASPEGYDPRKPFIEGAEVGVLNLRVRAYSDKKLPDKTPKITGKLVTKTGQKFTPTIGYDDLKIETEIEQLFKDKEKLVSSKMKKKEVKEKVEKEVKGKVEKELKGKVEKEVKEKIEKEGKKKVEKEVKEKTEKEGKGKPEKEEEEKEESPSSSDENAPIQVVIPNLWKDLNVAQMQKSNDELKVILEAVTNENKRLEEVIKQMMQEITFLRESLLSIVMKLGTVATTGVATAATTSADGGQAALTTPISTSPMAGKSGSAISASKTSAATDVSLTATSHAAGGVSASSVGATGTKSPVSRTASGAKSPISVGKGGKFDQTGAGAEIDNYLSAMLAGGGPTGGAKKSDGSSPTDAGEKKEFSLYFTGYAGGSKNSTYISASSPSTAKAKDLSFAFGNTADQLGSSGRPYSPSGSPSSGSGGGRAYRTSSVYL
ncbi:unnamed protein product [Acanthocheilonema viteae]|uniref:MSP domain-containing protein n=1 Tax=Acanthocheilonema viteae TaxID=6277 RepID=A0A498SJ61_ACAVI|nr:unnamed protein product [Acanthocheilonema viteae]